MVRPDRTGPHRDKESALPVLHSSDKIAEKILGGGIDIEI